MDPIGIRTKISHPGMKTIGMRDDTEAREGCGILRIHACIDIIQIMDDAGGPDTGRGRQ
jgi:hypothetical protein